MRYKSWPFYEDWQSIFGKDRSAGARAEEVADADDALHAPDASIADESQPVLSDYHLDDFFTPDQIHAGLHYDGVSSEAVWLLITATPPKVFQVRLLLSRSPVSAR